MLFLATAVLMLVYGGLALAHMNELLLLQGLIGGVQLLTILEAVTWFGFLMDINKTGEPICCPIASAAMFAIACTVIKRLVSRVLILIVSIGYGVVRQVITRNELIGVLALSAVYFILGFLVEIAEGNSMGEDGYAVLWTMGLFICEMCFIYWVMTGLKKTMEGLAQNTNSLKFQMYQNMSKTLTIFLVLWAVYYLIVLVLTWVIDMNAIETALIGSLWPVLYFAFLVVISVIWRPSTESHMLAMSFELSSDEISPDVELDNMNDTADDLESVDLGENNKSDAAMVSIDLSDNNNNTTPPAEALAVVEETLDEVNATKEKERSQM